MRCGLIPPPPGRSADPQHWEGWGRVWEEEGWCRDFSKLSWGFSLNERQPPSCERRRPFLNRTKSCLVYAVGGSGGAGWGIGV
jgi:hypothetical protein